MMRFCSIFNQLLQLFPRVEFQQAVVTTKAERHARGCTCWGQFVAMLFCQLSKAHSLREIAGGLASCEGRLAHLGITAPSRSTLAYANAHHPWRLYQAVFYHPLARCQAVAPRHKFRFKHKLLSLDATIIDLCASANALHTQIWTALIALLLLTYLQLQARFGWSLSNLVALLRMNLFVYRDLWAWLHEPFTAPPVPAEPRQEAFRFA